MFHKQNLFLSNPATWKLFMHLIASRYSRVHISWDEVFSKIQKKPSLLQK